MNTKFYSSIIENLTRWIDNNKRGLNSDLLNVSIRYDLINRIAYFEKMKMYCEYRLTLTNK